MIPPRVVLAFVAVASLHADSKKLTLDQRVEIMRGLTAEYATVKAPLPRSKKPLEFDAANSTWDKKKWDDAGKELGPAARIGDLVQVTHVDIDKDRILLEINNGMKGKRKFTDHIQIGIGNTTSPISGGNPTNAPSGTSIVLLFDGSIGEITAAGVKKLIAPVLDFEKHSATENYVDTLPPEIKQAIQEKKPIEGMDRDQVLLALGRPIRKSRESHDGVDYEDWIYGEPPGRMTFVTFAGPKVVRVKDTYAGLGGTIAETPGQP
jgi:hypothetical protein